MEVEHARIVYAPFRNMPVGHVFVLFRLKNGVEVVISPEADPATCTKFSLFRGLFRSYRLSYVINPPDSLYEYYRNERRALREYHLPLTEDQLNTLYQRMLARAENLTHQFEWYHTISNSCATNILRHLDEVRSVERHALQFVFLVFMTSTHAKSITRSFSRLVLR